MAERRLNDTLARHEYNFKILQKARKRGPNATAIAQSMWEISLSQVYNARYGVTKAKLAELSKPRNVLRIALGSRDLRARVRLIRRRRLKESPEQARTDRVSH